MKKMNKKGNEGVKDEYYTKMINCLGTAAYF